MKGSQVNPVYCTCCSLGSGEAAGRLVLADGLLMSTDDKQAPFSPLQTSLNLLILLIKQRWCPLSKVRRSQGWFARKAVSPSVRNALYDHTLTRHFTAWAGLPNKLNQSEKRTLYKRREEKIHINKAFCFNDTNSLRKAALGLIVEIKLSQNSGT